METVSFFLFSRMLVSKGVLFVQKVFPEAMPIDPCD